MSSGLFFNRPLTYDVAESGTTAVQLGMGNGHGASSSMVDSFSDLGGIAINQGTADARLPQLGFHAVHGQNVVLQKGGRVARRKESFCKGLAFSNRPVSVNENVCIRLTEVSTSWSGVLRFGVTNVDPETYRTIQVPKFACPDLTSKEGFWAKALPERYSVEGNILHFSITHTGDLYYGVNGVHKGVFLVGINVSLPIWIIVDIYGNSVAVEFIDPSDFRVPRTTAVTPRVTSASNSNHETTAADPPASSLQHVHSGTSRTNFDTLRFHQMTGRHVSLNSMRNIATRCGSEYTQGYVFSERPIRNNEKVVIEVIGVQQLYKGGLAFGVTCCDPSTLRVTDLPDDSSDLIEMPQYWVGIKDIALQPRVNTVLSFWITDSGEVKFEKDQGLARTVLHVDNSLPLYMYFDLYGSTQAIKLRGTLPVSRSHSPLPRATSSSTSAPTRVALPPLPTIIRRDNSALPSSRQSQPYEFSSNIMRVLLRDDANGTNTVPDLFDDDYEEDTAHTRRPALPPRRGAEESVLRRTVDDLLADNSSNPPRAPPLAPRLVTLGPLPAPPSRPPPPTPTAVSSTPATASTFSPFHNANTALESLLSRPSGATQDLPTSSRSSLPNLQVLNPTFTRARSAQLSVERDSSEGDDTPKGDELDECTVCMSARVNSALYKCGHSCMCYDCAMQTYRSSGLCPLCRASILDVIKIFKA
ncbi:Zinc finger C3HC4 type [Trichostrongylus colubriformis]|uniref:Zinc finger C3HC4 type n=1 Tax=Trichostrongylus colubriformis TaxID=6319 RepID=A0AAN8F816_TRICO